MAQFSYTGLPVEFACACSIIVSIIKQHWASTFLHSFIVICDWCKDKHHQQLCQTPKQILTYWKYVHYNLRLLPWPLIGYSFSKVIICQCLFIDTTVYVVSNKWRRSFNYTSSGTIIVLQPDLQAGQDSKKFQWRNL